MSEENSLTRGASWVLWAGGCGRAYTIVYKLLAKGFWVGNDCGTVVFANVLLKKGWGHVEWAMAYVISRTAQACATSAILGGRAW